VAASDATAATRHVYFFGAGVADGTREMKTVLGGKGANLAEMTNLGVPVPPGFTIACDVCMAYLRGGGEPPGLREEVAEHLRKLEAAAGKALGDPQNPLLVSVRSGGPVSMPGMMETILNLGLNDRTVAGLARASGNARFAYDSYRRFIQMYADVVLGVSVHDFEHLLKAKRITAGVVADSELGEEALRNLVEEYKALVRKRTGAEFPMDPAGQLWGAIEAVWKSWTLKKAVDYRRVNHISETLGTAVNVVAMVFGNMGDDSGTGVAFTRNPSTGERRFYGEFLVNAQGEDVVAGTRTPLHIDDMAERLPGAYAELLETQERLERHYRDMQDLEFTVERGKLYLLQTRTGKRTAAAAVRIAREMVAEGLIGPREAVIRVPAGQIDQLLHPIIDATVRATALCTGLPASPGAASGLAVFDADVAEQRAARGETSFSCATRRRRGLPRHGRGARDPHRARRHDEPRRVVARGMGKCAVVGAKDIVVDAEQRRFTVGETTVREGDYLTLDGATGRVYAGDLPTVPSEVIRVINGQLSSDKAPVYQSFAELLGWADEVRTLRVRANADTPRDARVARGFGAEGIGLCRTEHMFFEGERITAMREMIVARDEGGRRRALAKLLPMQRQDFEGIFEAMDGFPSRSACSTRRCTSSCRTAARSRSCSRGTLRLSREELTASSTRCARRTRCSGTAAAGSGSPTRRSPRCRARAIFEAAVRAMRRGHRRAPEIMIPLVGDGRGVRPQRAILERSPARCSRDGRACLSDRHDDRAPARRTHGG
jgi:pyruvate,orthophosphate dikinase